MLLTINGVNSAIARKILPKMGWYFPEITIKCNYANFKRGPRNTFWSVHIYDYGGIMYA